jgi:hypothetical protein
MTASKFALLSTAAAIALGFAAGPAYAATEYKGSGMAKALGSAVEDGENAPSPYKGTGMAAAIGSGVEDGANAPAPYKGTGMAAAIGSAVENEEGG